ncbi:MAG: hypothetical protein ACTIID_12910 [Brevibacterium linens]|uniref:hypothetical protein n=1 Tax=Brevibacterium linens TaxID=1703 RepID=UPI003F9C7E45
MADPTPDPEPWLGVYFSATEYGRQQGYNDGYRDGHRDGHFDGWNAALARAKANDVEFLRGLVDEFRRREIEDEHMDTSDRREWVRKLIESLEAKRRRDELDARNRRDRTIRQHRSNAA